MTAQTIHASLSANTALAPAQLLVRISQHCNTPRTTAKVYNSQGLLVESNERPGRIEAIAQGLTGPSVQHVSGGVSLEPAKSLLHCLHDPKMLAYLEVLSAGCPEGGSVFADQFQADPSGSPTTIEHRTWHEALQAAAVAVAAADDLAHGSNGDAYALLRPPGHHAGRAAFGAYCFLNNAALAALHLEQSFGLRPAVLDIDYHAGDGTMDCLTTTPDIAFASVHRSTEEAYPYRPEILPARPGQWMFGLKGQIDEALYLATLDSALARLLDHSPRCLIISIGYDIVQGDPHGGWRLSPEIFSAIAARLKAIDLPLLFIQEGGYRTEVLAACSAALLRGLRQGKATHGPF